MNNLSQDIENVLKECRTCWAARDFAALERLWDPDEPEPTYLAEEIRAPLFSYAEMRDYWERTKAATRGVHVETWNLRVRAIAPDLATAVYDMRWIGEFAGYNEPIGGDSRVTAVFRRRPAGWRFIHYIEAPLAPIVYFKRCYEQFAASPPPHPKS
jgi:hypothetical protein